MSAIGPVETWMGTDDWSEDERNRAIVLDLAGATETDVDEAAEAVSSARRVSNEWNYFTAVITRRIAERVRARRELEETTP